MRFITDLIKKDEEAIEAAILRREKLIEDIRAERERHKEEEARINTKQLHVVTEKQTIIQETQE